MNDSPAAKIILKPGRQASLLRRHPWIFSGAVARVEGQPGDGSTVEVVSHDGKWLARAGFSSVSQIRARVMTFIEDEAIGPELIRDRIVKAVNLRRSLGMVDQAGACRLVYAESDGLPGLIVDRYGDFLVCQFLSAVAERWKQTITGFLMESWPCRGIYERSEADSRLKEGLKPVTGTLSGEAPPELILFSEHEARYYVDVCNGHKTGFYLDQSLNRRLVRKYARDREVLNAFSYTGGFGIATALAGAARVINADASEDALSLARRNFELNGADPGRVEYVQEDVFHLLRKYRDSRLQFDMIILDPPKFVASAGQLDTGARGYKDINLLAFKLLRPGGILITFSCSGYVKPDLFQKIVADAAIDAGRQACIVDYLAQSADHPVSLNFPEGLYLKGLVCLST